MKAPTIGSRYGRLTVTGRSPGYNSKSHSSEWECLCDCGATTLARQTNLMSGNTKSCGCLRQTFARKHGLYRVPEYKAWVGMKQRCQNPDEPAYAYYGARGISVCARWSASFTDFLKDMGGRPGIGYSIERNDNHGNYEPSNCRWATMAEQLRNTRRNVNLTYNGRTLCLTDWAKVTGLSFSTLHHRMQRGWTIERAISSPAQKRGETVIVAESVDAVAAAIGVKL